jgi:DNA-binding PadR family transcriptional regulator
LSMNFRYFILGLLAQQPMSGYDIKSFLESLDWLIGSPSFGSVYPILHALLKDDLATVDVVRRDGKPPRKVYSITEAGRLTLREWISQPVEPGVSLKTFLMRLMLASNLSRSELIAHLEQRRSQVAFHRTCLEQDAGAQDESVDLGQRLAFDYGSAAATAELAWLDRTLEWLSQQPLAEEILQSESTAA